MHTFTRTLILCGAALMLGQATVGAQVARPIGRANIPFTFDWNGAHLLPGSYVLHLNGPFVSMNDGHKATAAISHLEEDSGEGGPAHMVFHCVARQCFLREISMGKNGYRLLFSPGKMEKQERQRLLASGSSPEQVDDPVVVALQ